MKILSDFETMRKLMDSYVCLEMVWTNLLSRGQSLRNSIEAQKFTLIELEE